MKKTPKEIIEVFASHLRKLGMEEGKVTALFNADGTEVNDDFETQLADFEAARVSKIKDQAHKDGFAAGEKKGNDNGFKDGGKKWETEIKEKYGITSDKHGSELVDEIVASKANVTLDADKVKLHAEYIKMENLYKKQLKEQNDAAEQKFQQRESEIAREKMLTKVFSQAKELVAKEKYALPKDPKRADAQLQMLANRFQGFDFTETDGTIIITKDGKPYEDKLGAKVKFEDFIKTNADELWDKEVAGKGSPGNKTGGEAGAGTKINVAAPANQQEYIKAVASAKTAEERIAISDAWNQSQQQN